MLFGIFIYDGVEPIDLATFGVLSMACSILTRNPLALLVPVLGQSRSQVG